jgi:hypothetical protein
MLEDWLDNSELEEGYQEIVFLEETCQHVDQLEEVGAEPVQEEMA